MQFDPYETYKTTVSFDTSQVARYKRPGREILRMTVA